MALIPVRQNSESYYEVDENEALNIQRKLISEWEPRTEVWPLNYGHYIVAVVSGVSGVIINTMFRRKLRLLHHGLASTTFFLAVGPGLLSAMSYEHFITHKIMVYESGCSLCHTVKSVFMQNAHAVLYPLVISPAISLAIAGNMGYRIPRLFEVKEIVRLWWSVVRPYSSTFGQLLLFNSLLAGVLTYRQLISMDIVTQVLLKVQERENDEEFIVNN